MGLRHLLGCSSLNSNGPAEGWRMVRQLENFRVPREFETAPTAAYACPPELQDADAQPLPCQTHRSGFLATPAVQGTIPKLLGSCLVIGERIAAPPAWDREFRTLDFLTLLDLKLLSAAARNRFFAPLTS
jgi:putative hemolysin